MARNRYGNTVSTNASKILQNIKSYTRQLESQTDELLEQVCKIFVREARKKLRDSGYNVANLLDNIFYRKFGFGRYQIAIRNNKDRETMFFLEFGTGLVGKENSHPQAKSIGWRYMVNPSTLTTIRRYAPSEVEATNSIGVPVGNQGWYYFDEKDNDFRFTSGLIAVAYLYDTMNQMDLIIAEAKEIVSRRRK